MSKNDKWHIKVRPAYYRGNFDYNEGPHNRINRPGDTIVKEDSMVVSEEDFNDIKEKDIEKKRNEGMKIEVIEGEDKYPEPTDIPEKNDIFMYDKDYYEEVYTNRDKEIDKVLSREDGRKIKIISNRQKGLSKLAIIRGDGVRPCPFGLPMLDACKNAGKSIDRMAPLTDIDKDKQKENVSKANRLVYAYHKTNKRCPYADKILEKHNNVDCDFGDTGARQQSAPFRGSPLYPRTFHGLGYSGLYGYPLGFYTDYEHSRNLFYGLFSLLGFSNSDDLIKLADKYDKSGDLEKADILDDLLARLKNLREKYEDTFKKIEKYLEDYRKKALDEGWNPELIWDLSHKYNSYRW